MPEIRSRELIAATGTNIGGGKVIVDDDNDQRPAHGNDDNVGEIDPRSVFWLARHSDGDRCPNCPNCVCLSVLRTLTQIATHPCLLQVDYSKHSLVDSKNENKKDFLEKAIPESLVEEMGGR